ncbi:MAG TPA: hypothetical protein VMC05_07810, partial [Xanthobacteraceae bacterium]|nr:hypothetical protein [Xanthobacteraceae bacterium]
MLTLVKAAGQFLKRRRPVIRQRSRSSRLGVTAYIALLFAFGGLPEPVVALYCVIGTTVCGSIARAAHFYVGR